MKNKKIFVSGAAGVIGSELIPLLVKQGAIVMCGDLELVPSHFPKNVLYRQGDLNYLTQEEIDLFNPEVFIHLAATFERSAETYEHWEENFWHNIKLSNHLMTLIRNVEGIKRIVNASSYLIYNKSLYQFKEVREKPYRLKETDPINPRNLTGLAKLAHEIELDFLSKFKSDKFTSVSARIYRGYGINSRDVISRWIRDLLNDKEITIYNQSGFFDYMYGEDTAKGLIKLAQVDYTGIINLGTGRSRKVKDIVNILKKYFPNLKAKYIKTDELIESSEADITKLKSVINWEPEKYLEDTIPILIEFEKNKISPQGNDVGNVLITSVASKTALVKNVRDATKKINSTIKIYGGDIDKDCISRFFVDTLWKMPSISDIEPNQFKDYCIKNNIKLVIPSRDGELLFFSEIKDFLSSFGIHVMISNEKSIKNCIDKLLFYSENRTTIPEIIEANTNIELLKPCEYYVVKERYGAGALSIGIRLDKKSSIEHAKTLSDPIFQPFVAGEEFSIDAYVDKNNTIKGTVIRKRVKIVNGESQVTTSLYNKDLEFQFKKVIKKLHLSGHIILQAIVVNKEVHVIKCNARFGGASSLSIYKGLDSFYWAYLEALNVDITSYPFIASEKEITQVKYVDTKYIVNQ